MKCDLCGKRTAVIFVQEQTAPSLRTELHLCAECAKERGVRSDGEFRLSISDLFSSLTGGERIDSRERPPMDRCPVCACSLNELKQRGMASCPDCYASFAQELLRSVYSDSRSRRHVGRLPELLSGPSIESRESLLSETRKKLDEAIASEDYEEAARRRDEIRSLEKGDVSHG